MNLKIVVVGLLLAAVTAPLFGQSRDELVRGDRKRITAEGFWIYNDLPKAFAQATKENKPIIVVLRCIPCHECVKLDDEIVDNDPMLRPLLEKFVRARQVSTNGLDLELFQYDTDQSFAVFLLNADGTIYGRFGTRSHRTDWTGDVSIKGLAQAMSRVLQLHADYPQSKSLVVGKRGQPLEVATPEQFPMLKNKYTDQLNYKGNVVKSCIHCHQIGDAQRAFYHDRGKPIPDKIFYPYPHPKSIGLTIDPDQGGVVKAVEPQSIAGVAGLKKNDRIETLNGQIILSIADFQWVLHQADPAGDIVKVVFRRDGVSAQTKFKLDKGWRENADLSWRASTWAYRRIATGGMQFEPVPAAGREKLGLADGQMALRIKFLGKYGPHAAARRAGFKVGDVVLEYGGRDDLVTSTRLMQHGVNHCKAGTRIEIKIERNGKRQTLKLPIQK